MFLGVLVWTLQTVAEVAKLALVLAGRAAGSSEEQGTPG
jgi:hypothetical protein